MIKGVIFDMDGVLVDSEPLYHEFEYNFFRKLGADITREYLAKYVGTSMTKTIEGICTEYNLKVSSKDDIFKEFSDNAKSIYTTNPGLKLFDGVMDWLNFFSRKNIPMIVASSTYKEKVEICLKRFKIYEYFIDYIGGDEVINPKPDAEIFSKACSMLKLKPHDCLVIEDSENGIKAAKAAGCYTIGFLNNGENRQNLNQADMTVNSFAEENPPAHLF